MNKQHVSKFIILVLVVALATVACGGAAATEEPQELESNGPDVPMEAPVEEEEAAPAEEEWAAEEEPMEEAFSGAPPQQPPNDEPYPDTFFEDYGTNPFIDTEDDHLSTFALDVDTGSYTIARRYIRDGYLPPADAIRVEEFVNYFDQGYESPEDGKAFAISMDGAPSPFTETERYEMLRVGIQGFTIAPEDRKDASLTFVIDVSGSMDMENRLELVKDALELLVEQMRPSDTVGIVVYGSEARVVLEPTSGRDQEEILRAIKRLKPEGSTNAEAGLKLGYKQALQAFNAEGVNRVVLCSDGVANVGNTGPESIWDTIDGYASEGITLTTVGFGMGNYNDVLMEQLADMGDGFYAYVDDIQEADRLFNQNLVSTLQVIALDTKVQVDFNPEVVSRYRLVGFENRAIADEDFRDNTVDAGEIGAGHSVTALYEVKLFPQASGEIATVYLRWEDPDNHEVIETNEYFYTGDLAESFSAASPNFQLSVLVAEYAEILKGSYWAEGSTLAGVLEDAERLSRFFDEDPDVYEFVEILRKAVRISR